MASHYPDLRNEGSSWRAVLQIKEKGFTVTPLSRFLEADARAESMVGKASDR